MKLKFKVLSTLIIVLMFSVSLFAQSVSYKSGVLNVDGKDIAKVVKLKGGFAQPANYELYSMSGEKLIIAVMATDFPPDPNNNSSFYYRFSFLTTNQVGLFTLSILSAEKSFAKLVGESGIIVDDKLNEAKVNELIALKSKSPVVQAEYHLARRNMMFPVRIKDRTVIQGRDSIGRFKNISSGPEGDTYEFSLNEGLVIAKVSFTGGNNATKFIINTKKDNLTMVYTIPTDGTDKVYARSENIDQYEATVKRIVKWLVDHKYL